MKVLITGGCGFIGSEVVRVAMEQGHEVVNLDKLTYAGNPANVADVADDPRYSMAMLLREAIDCGAPPSLARLPMTPERVWAAQREAQA